jgi:hypothetical protein
VSACDTTPRVVNAGIEHRDGYVMGKPPIFVEPFASPNLDLDDEAEKHAAPATATKAIYIAVIVGLVVLFLLVAIALHVPRGE